MNYATTIARSYGISAVTMNSITIEHLLQAQIVIFCVSTWGKGTFPDGVVIAGNPAKIIAKTEEWAQRHYDLQDYQI